jgi:hypothetical protein
LKCCLRRSHASPASVSQVPTIHDRWIVLAGKASSRVVPLRRPRTAASKNAPGGDCDNEVIGILKIGPPIGTELLWTRDRCPAPGIRTLVVQLDHEAVPWLMPISIPPQVCSPEKPLAFGRRETCLPVRDFERPERFRADTPQTEACLRLGSRVGHGQVSRVDLRTLRTSSGATLTTR